MRVSKLRSCETDSGETVEGNSPKTMAVRSAWRGDPCGSFGGGTAAAELAG